MSVGVCYRHGGETKISVCMDQERLRGGDPGKDLNRQGGKVRVFQMGGTVGREVQDKANEHRWHTGLIWEEGMKRAVIIWECN